MSPKLDDPRLTAYALGELDSAELAAERAAIEQLLAVSAEAREIVAQHRATAALLGEALCDQESPGLDDVRRAAIFTNDSRVETSPVRLHLGDTPQRTDVYHVITHPTPEPRRYRTNLFAVAAAIAIVFLTLGMLLSSIFRPHRPNGSVASNPQSQPSRVFPFVQRTGAPRSSDDLPNVPDPIAGRASRDIIELLPDAADASRPLFGVATLPVIPAPPATRDAAASPTYALSFENPFFDAARHPLSTFAFNVAGPTYDFVRRALAQNKLPDSENVQIEELINAFPYDYAPPAGSDTFAAHIEIAACPWSSEHRLVRIGLKAKESAGTEPVAKDLSIRIEFNPAQVSAYRLIGYDRRLQARDMSSDRSKHNQVAPGQSVTALYELIPASVFNDNATPSAAMSSLLKYQKPSELTGAAGSKEVLTLKLRYQQPVAKTGAASGADPAPIEKLQEFTAVDPGGFAAPPSDDFQFAAALAAFGMILRDSPSKGVATYDVVLSLAQNTAHPDPTDARNQFINLVNQARRL